MKRIIYAMAFLLGMSVLFISCNKDNSSAYSKLIIGTWQVVTYDSYHDGSLVSSEPGDGITFTFTADGKYFSSDPNLKGDYSISGNKLRVANMEATILKMSYDVMQLESVDNSGGSGVDKNIITYQKVK